MQKQYLYNADVGVPTSDTDPQFLITKEDYVPNSICALLSVINCWRQRAKDSNISKTTYVVYSKLFNQYVFLQMHKLLILLIIWLHAESTQFVTFLNLWILRNNEFLNEKRNSETAPLQQSHFASIPLGTLLLAALMTTDISRIWSATRDTK